MLAAFYYISRVLQLYLKWNSWEYSNINIQHNYRLLKFPPEFKKDSPLY